MRLRDTTRRAGRSLKNAKARTLLTSLAIGVGAFTITLSLAAGSGGRQYAEDIVTSNTDVRELYVYPKQENQGDLSEPKEYTDQPTVAFSGGPTMELLQNSDIDKIKATDGVESVTPIYTVASRYVTRDGQKRYQSTVDVFTSSIKQEYIAGSGDNVSGNRVVISEQYSKALGFADADAAIGAPINVVIAATLPGIPDKTFVLNVAGVFKKSVLGSIGATTGIQAHRDIVRDMYKYNQQGTPIEDAYVGATVIAKDKDDVDAIKSTLGARGYEAQTAEDLMGFIFQFINVLQGILIGFGALAVLTSVFGIINTQYISVLERTQQIGLMKALGMRRRDVGRLFKLEAAWIGFLGGAIGSLLALGAGSAANPWIRDVLSLGENTNLLIFEPWTFAAVIIGLMVVSVTAGILPARKAAKLDPIEALRTE